MVVDIDGKESTSSPIAGFGISFVGVTPSANTQLINYAYFVFFWKLDAVTYNM
jgi:hypothetical protein